MDLGNSKESGQCVIGSQLDGDGINTLPSPYQLFGNQWATIDESKICLLYTSPSPRDED